MNAGIKLALQKYSTEIRLKLNIFTVEITGEQGIMLAYQGLNYNAVTYPNGCLLQHPSIGAPAAIPNTEG